MSKSEKIIEHIRKIKDKEYLIPNFQREFIWDKKRILKLLDTIFNDRPLGGLLVWRSRIQLVSKHYDNKENKGLKSYILDGQQRLTALYIAMHGELPYYYTKEEVKLKEYKIIIDLKNYPKHELLFKENITDPETQIKLSHLLSENFSSRDILNRNHLDHCSDLRRCFLAKEIFYEQFDTDDVTTAINVFHDINTTGVKLTGAELLLAYISGYWQNARELIIEEKNKRKVDNFDFSLDMYTQFILACLQSTNNSTTDKTLHNKDMKNKVIECWKNLTKDDGAIAKTIAFFKKYKVLSSTEIANKPSVIPIVYSHYHFELNEEKEKRLAFYFFTTQKFAYFRTNVNTRVTEQLKLLEIVKDNKENILNQLQTCIDIVTEGRILNSAFLKTQTLQSSLFFMMKWTFRNNNAVCLDEKHSIDLNSPNYTFEKDHIFPRALLRPKYQNSDNRRMIDEIANICFLKQKANRVKSNLSASKFLNECKEKNPEALKKQCIPEDKKLWELNNFESFLESRRELIVKAIEEFTTSLCKKDTSSQVKKEIFSNDQVLEEIASDEDHDTEFKSSLRWDYKTNIKNIELEKNIIKTIAGFTNHLGGNIYIGVSDNNELLGIEKDLATLDNSKEKFLRHLSMIIEKNFNVTFINNNISINIYEINKKDLLEKFDDEKREIEEDKLLYEEESDHIKTVCLIRVKPSEDLMFIEEAKGGLKSKVCYVRRANRTAPIPSDEVIKYNEERKKTKLQMN